MLHVTYKNITVIAQRSGAPARTFSSSDVPRGRDSAIVKSCKVARSNGIDFPSPPDFTEAEMEAHEKAFLDSVVALSLFDADGKPIVYGNLTDNQVMEPSLEEVNAEFYSNFPPSSAGESLRPREVVDLMGMGSCQKHSDIEACRAAMILERRTERAKRLLENAIEQCLVVPELSEEFLSQFVLVESSAVF